jgi:hypothetical protein
MSSWTPPDPGKRVSKPPERYGNPVIDPSAADIHQLPKSKSTSSSSSSSGAAPMDYQAAPSQEKLEKIFASGKGTLMEFETREEMEKALKKEPAGSMSMAIPNMNPGGEQFQVYSQPLSRTLSQSDSMISSSLTALTNQTMNTLSSNRITEAVGENAAIQYMTKHFSDAKMLWGPAVHEGPGIDQIWYSKTGDSLTFYIVEAKGPGAKLTDDPFVAKGFGTQMSLPWVLHNLATMVRVAKTGKNFNQEQRQAYQSVIDLMKAMGLTEADTEVGLGGASKKYYKCYYAGAKGKTRLYGIVTTAYWAGVGLDGTAPKMIDYSQELEHYLNKIVEYEKH